MITPTFRPPSTTRTTSTDDGSLTSTWFTTKPFTTTTTRMPVYPLPPVIGKPDGCYDDGPTCQVGSSYVVEFVNIILLSIEYAAESYLSVGEYPSKRNYRVVLERLRAWYKGEGKLPWAYESCSCRCSAAPWRSRCLVRAPRQLLPPSPSRDDARMVSFGWKKYIYAFYYRTIYSSRNWQLKDYQFSKLIHIFRKNIIYFLLRIF